MESRSAALERAHEHAVTWLDSLDERPVPPAVDADEMVRRLGDLPDGPTPAAEVVDLLAEACEPGLVAIPSGRFFGMVIGGSLPAALGADWLTSAWDQNVGLRSLTPAGAAVEEVAGRWLLDLFGLPSGSAVGFVTGATMANFTCLAAARDTVLRRAGYDVRAGLRGGPGVRVLVGPERHPSVDLPLRFLGLGDPIAVPADAAGRIRPEALAESLADVGGPAIVVLQAGNIHSGDFDPFADCVALAHERGAWVHEVAAAHPAASAARWSASSERRTSSSVVLQLLTEMRTIARSCQRDPDIQVTPSASSASPPDRVRSSSPKLRQTWVKTTSLCTSQPGISRAPSASVRAWRASRSTRSATPERPRLRSAAQTANPRARREDSGTQL
jgi:hypothetical protein